MEQLGINTGFLIFQLCNIVLLVGWPILSIVAILGLRKQSLPQTTQALWVLIILVIPILGAIAYWLVKPTGNQTAEK